MGLKDLLMNAIFVETDEKEKEVKNATNDATAPSTPSKASATTKKVADISNVTAASAITEGETNEKMFNTLCEILDEKKLPGSDYLKLKQAVETLRKVLPGNSEDDLLKAAFATIQANDRTFTKKVLNDSIDYYIKVAKETQDNEISGLDKEKKDKIDEPANAVSQLNAEIADLSKQIEDKKVQVQNISASILKEKTLLDKREKDLIATVNTMIVSLQNDKDKLNNILT